MDQQLFDAVAASDADAVYNILTSKNPNGGASVNVNAALFGPKNDAPLHEAIRKNNPDIVKLLLLACAKVNTKNNLGVTSLHLVACCKENVRSVDIFRMLLVARAKLDETDIHGRTPLYCACRGNRVVLIEGLLDKGASLTATDIKGFTALHTS